MDKKRRHLVQVGLTGTGLALFSGCEAVKEAARNAEKSGLITANQRGSIERSSDAVAATFKDFTPEQEYYVGRTVSANIFQSYRPYYNDARLSYLNMVGMSLAIASDKPETFGGYHFAILDSNEINAFAAPGGFIFVTLGMLRCCPHEDALAAVLAHEIAHVQLKHGLQAIKKSRVSEAVKILASETDNIVTGGELNKLVSNFEGSIGDITTTMINNGYSRSYEREADAMALTIMDKAGYSPKGMGDMLTLMSKTIKPGGKDFSKTHPSPQDRLALVKPKIQSSPAVPAFRQQRLKSSMGQV